MPGEGSIPACAGEPSLVAAAVAVGTVYPRVCGGTAGGGAGGGDTNGLSPRVRGNPMLSLITSTVPGLSPRVRGNQAHYRHSNRLSGSIPACAGEPYMRGRVCFDSAVYPRVCGGTHTSAPFHFSCWGLSPRVRGNRKKGRRTQGGDRSIPACAGEPTSPLIRATIHKVYPRVCGGTLSAIHRGA